jgi:hypothetical protein
MEKQTTVEWLVEQLLIYGDKAFNKEISLGQYHIKKQELIEQAKQMEKEQQIEIYRLKAIIEFYEQGCGKEGCKATEPHVH